MSASCITVKGLSVRYGEAQVLDHVDFECESGQFVAIVGKSGTGKTTFLNALAGFIPYHGTIAPSPPPKLGYVFQDHALFPWLTVQKNVEFGLEHLPHKTRLERAREVLKRTELLDFAGRYPWQLSGGQIQRVALARFLAPDPELLLMDEPYGALDVNTREKMQNWLLHVWQESQKTIIFVTHSIDEALFLADRLLVIREGKFVLDLKVPFARPRQSQLRFAGDFQEVKQTVVAHMENSENGAT